MPFQQSPRSRPTVSPLHYIHHNKQYFGGLLPPVDPFVFISFFNVLFKCNIFGNIYYPAFSYCNVTIGTNAAGLAKR